MVAQYVAEVTKKLFVITKQEVMSFIFCVVSLYLSIPEECKQYCSLHIKMIAIIQEIKHFETG